MDEKEFKALQSTMPWRQVNLGLGRGGIGAQIAIINKHGQEVDLIVMCRLLEVITGKLALKPAEEKSNA
jgi:hypothetical protein